MCNPENKWLVFETIALIYLYTCLPRQYVPVENGQGRGVHSSKKPSVCACMLEKGACQRLLETASNTEAVPGTPGFCLVALRKLQRISSARIMRAQD